MRRLLFVVSFASLACAAPAPTTQGMSGTISDANGPVPGAIVRLQYFPTTACRDLGAASSLTPAQRDEFARCATNLAPLTTDSSGAFAFTSLAPGWFSMSVRWTIDQKPAVAAPNTVVDGFLIIYLEARKEPPQYVVTALGTAAFELKSGEQAVRNFNFRP